MSTRFLPLLVFLPAALFAQADTPSTWKDKPVSQWSDDEAKQVLEESPWAKKVTPSVTRSSDQAQSGRGGRRGGGITIGAGGIGFPGGGGRGRGGGGGGGRRNPDSDTQQDPAPELRLVWESATPVREAELKTGKTDAPSFEEKYYAIAVYGVPARMAVGDSKTLANDFKKAAMIQRSGKKDLKPANVEILRRENGPVILYLFPKKQEIARSDRDLEFTAKIGRLEFSEVFDTDEMVYQGKLEL